MIDRREKAAARVAQEIVQTIYDEGLKPGDRYLSEAEALARHGVSRATFREALRFLEFQGIVRVRAGPGGGAIVERPSWPHLASAFGLLLQFAEAPLSAVMAARKVLDPAMAREAAANATEAQIRELRALRGKADAEVHDAAAFAAAYRAFWATVAEATGNPVTAMLWPALRAVIDSGHFIPPEEYRETLVVRLDEMLDAIERRDADGAEALIARLDAEFAERLVAHYPERIARPIAWSDILPRER